jgi:hypothetical protein
VQVPDGGVARVEIGLTGSACDAQGCRESDWLFDIVGVGPPPDAPLPSVATARVELPADAVTAGRPAVIGIRLAPRVAWDPAAFRYPDTLLVEVAVPRGRTILDAQAALADGSPGTYSASVTIPDPGEYRVVAAVPQQGADPVPFSASLTTMTVEPPGAVPSPAGEGDGESGLGAVIPAIVAVVAVLAVVALLAGRARFRDRDA